MTRRAGNGFDHVCAPLVRCIVVAHMASVGSSVRVTGFDRRYNYGNASFFFFFFSLFKRMFSSLSFFTLVFRWCLLFACCWVDYSTKTFHEIPWSWGFSPFSILALNKSFTLCFCMTEHRYLVGNG